MGGQTGKHLRKHHESQMFPQQCFLVCPGLYSKKKRIKRREKGGKRKNEIREFKNEIKTWNLQIL
jgi:hypothetical protein